MSDHPSLEELQPIIDTDPAAAARRLEALLFEGDDSDERIVELLRDRRTGDPVLAHLSLDSLERLALRRLEHLSDRPTREARERTWDLLDLCRRPSVLVEIRDAGAGARWSELLLDLVVRSHLTFGELLAHRAASSGSRPLFRTSAAAGETTVTWRQTAGRVELIGRGLLALLRTEGLPEGRVAIYSNNRLEMALADLACLSSGIVNVIVPGTATESDLRFILEQSGASVVLVGGREQLERLTAVRDELPGIRHVIALDPSLSGGRPQDIKSFDRLLGFASDVSTDEVLGRRDAVRIDDLATIMFTSGTTGTPKGICFSHRNIVFKRFARALALPEIGEGDRFLCYLPLYHTFGRFLEMTGCVFWNATYAFAESPSIDVLSRQMRELRPTVFISIPMKWMQLYDLIRGEVDIETGSEEEIRRVVDRTTGGALRWGLSAAGYLPPEVFRFFQRYGIELMSGFGMTEATGGITMTPPGAYREDSLGLPLPGIEVALAEDGEMIVRGPYVMTGYLADEGSFDADGWFHTGDLMEADDDGFFRIVDRKKDIYKNIQGQTIAPQKIENLFRDFDSVGKVFLVGDHRPYNTALIWPNRDFEDLDLDQLSADDLKSHFRSLVVTANQFLAPFERIVDFSVIDRELDPERGELTPKGTYRRRQVERSFADEIRLLYRRTTLTVGGVRLIVPNWLFQALGITTQELRAEDEELLLISAGTRLACRRIDEHTVQIGEAAYATRRETVDLGLLLSVPRLWLGNDELVRFAPLSPVQRDRRRRRGVEVSWAGRLRRHRPDPDALQHARDLLEADSFDLPDLHRAALLLDSAHDGSLGVRILERIADSAQPDLVEEALRTLRRGARARSAAVARDAFSVLVRAETDALYRDTVSEFLDQRPDLLDEETRMVVVRGRLSREQIDAFVVEAERRCTAETAGEDSTVADMLRLLAEYGASHPAHYRRLRWFVTRMAMVAPSPAVRTLARTQLDGLVDGFRSWLGTPARIAVDPETGAEYGWSDVLAFADDIDEDVRQLLRQAIASVPLLHEAVFLFSRGTIVRLDDILPQGIWVRTLGSDHGKTVYRVAVRTRHRDSHDIAINHAHSLDPESAGDEIDWLVVCSEPGTAGPLSEEVGGNWPQHRLWTEEFIAGETLDRALRRFTRHDADGRFPGVWSFAAWSALGAYIDFWNRTGRRMVIADPTPSNVIVPMHDYQTGARLVSISSRAPFESLDALLRSLRRELVASIESEHPELEGVVGWSTLFSALLETVGEEEGVALLRAAADDAGEAHDDGLDTARTAYLEKIERGGFMPRRLYFASLRYRRWAEVNPAATRTARARTLQELFTTYALADLQGQYPEVRPRFFQQTVFQHAPTALAKGLEEIVHRLRRRQLAAEDLSSAVADLRAHLRLEDDHDYFLARLSYPYLRPEDEAGFIAAESAGTPQSEMVVTLDDADGRPFRIRHAVNPKEVARLHRLFVAAKLPVQFRPEHRFLVAVSERGHLIGGLFYEVDPEEHAAHMDKVVVSEAFRGKGVAGALIEELCNRLRISGYRSLTTGFFRPQFFYRYGFAVERRYAGLVRSLVDDQPAPAEPEPLESLP